MKYIVEVEINDILLNVCSLYLDYDQFSNWQEAYLGMETIFGIPGQTGYKGKLFFQGNNQKMEMMETVELNRMPDLIIQIYEVNNVWNRCINHFKTLNDKTIWQMDVEFRFDKEIMYLRKHLY
ncbi:hypothetical protein [Acholeplasma granularum]|uniref:hypothetical protein n=1 Tax=Acholeplasma granularum TaxID=264635 RepID=UPI000470C529|nr:hypothetical protein [Acholeplasma granularum]